MTKAALTLALFCLFVSPALAQEPGSIVILQANDPSAPTTVCDVTHGDAPVRVRPCYIPLVGIDAASDSGFLPSHGHLGFSIAVTFDQTTMVEIEYDQVAFLSTEHGPFPKYATGIGIDNPRTICPGISSVMNLDSPGSTGFTLVSRCIVTVTPGTHTFYALESARNGASAFNGPGNQLLTVRYQQ